MSTSPTPRRAKLELLVRGEADESFEIREVPSAAAWVQMRPQRVEPEAWELAEVVSRVGRQRSFILKNRHTDRFLMLSERERFLWDQMDGRTSVQELATKYLLAHGEFDFELIPSVIRKLQQAQLLVLKPASRLREVVRRNRRRRFVHALHVALTALERINISSRRVQPVFARAYQWGGRLLFTPAFTTATLAFGVLGVVAAVRLWRDAGDVAAGLGGNPVLALLVVKLLFIATLAAHQFVHGLALIHYGRRVREFGFTFLHGFVPTFYVDVTDIFMTNRRARVVTAISGALVHLVLGAACFLLAGQLEPGFTQAFTAASGMIQLQAFVISLYPFAFVELDGYHVLVDTHGLPTLKHDALSYTGGLFRGAWGASSAREAGLWIGYVVLSAFSVGAFIAFNAWMIVHATH